MKKVYELPPEKLQGPQPLLILYVHDDAACDRPLRWAPPPAVAATALGRFSLGEIDEIFDKMLSQARRE